MNDSISTRERLERKRIKRILQHQTIQLYLVSLCEFLTHLFKFVHLVPVYKSLRHKSKWNLQLLKVKMKWKLKVIVLIFVFLW